VHEDFGKQLRGAHLHFLATHSCWVRAANATTSDSGGFEGACRTQTTRFTGLPSRKVRQAEAWRWCSLWRRTSGDAAAQALLSAWPVRMPQDWTYWINQPQNEAEVEALRRCVRRGRPFGTDEWVSRIARQLGLEADRSSLVPLP